ncbi:hypothetical protein HYX12_01330 [Candidatus Woesearchaeota archaeon]|nr:hypothetical protein [Candidatus Woesearchaeota archaeon]
MDDEYSNGEKDDTEEQMVDAGGLDSSEEGFIKGYAEDEEVTECAECGVAVREEKKVVKEFDGESYTFCSKECAKDFEESVE